MPSKSCVWSVKCTVRLEVLAVKYIKFSPYIKINSTNLPWERAIVHSLGSTVNSFPSYLISALDIKLILLPISGIDEAIINNYSKLESEANSTASTKKMTRAQDILQRRNEMATPISLSTLNKLGFCCWFLLVELSVNQHVKINSQRYTYYICE